MSPFTRPSLIRVAEAIPFGALTAGSTDKLYALKGEVIHRGMRARYGVEFPVFDKRRFQHGAADDVVFNQCFSVPPERYREHLLGLFAS